MSATVITKEGREITFANAWWIRWNKAGGIGLYSEDPGKNENSFIARVPSDAIVSFQAPARIVDHSQPPAMTLYAAMEIVAKSLDGMENRSCVRELREIKRKLKDFNATTGTWQR